MRILLTGADGMVGSHMLKYLLENTEAQIVAPVSLRYKGTSARLRHVLKQFPHAVGAPTQRRVKFIMHDLTAPFDYHTAQEIGQIDVIMNIASESHVDRSIDEPVPFVQNNVSLMLNMLEFARLVKPALFLHMSTDEVYGPAYEDERHAEWASILPSNPYSASKAAQEAIAVSYWRTYGVPLILTNTMNIFGEMQDPEKYPAKVIRCLKAGQPVPVHTTEDGVPGSRFYLHAENLADAWWFLVRKYSVSGVGTFNEDGPFLPTYETGFERPLRLNIVGEREVDNLDFASHIAEVYFGERRDFPFREVDFHGTRPGHDLRYALDGTKLAALGWSAPVGYNEGIARMVAWYKRNPEWLDEYEAGVVSDEMPARIG